jgi:hypothetical protein
LYAATNHTAGSGDPEIGEHDGNAPGKPFIPQGDRQIENVRIFGETVIAGTLVHADA